jgi:predicted aminopeptidase
MTRAVVLLSVAVAGSGCFSTRYLLQAASGQYQLLHLARPLEKVVEDPKVDPQVRALLRKVPALKRFAEASGLKATPSYTQYVDLKRPAAVWVVQACAPLSFTVRRWQFPIVGSVPYLGFFDPESARAYARELEAAEALDVTVRTAAAYSTLGWFKDPVLSTMIPDGELALGELANVILHESVHATVYVADQSAFDESLASFVADGLTPELLLRFGREAPVKKAWDEAQERSEQFGAALRRTHAALAALYDSKQSDARKREEKARLLGALQATLGLKRAFNNADLAGVRTYDTGTEAFERLRSACASWPRMLQALATLRPEHFAEPQQQHFDGVLDALAARACPKGAGQPIH